MVKAREGGTDAIGTTETPQDQYGVWDGKELLAEDETPQVVAPKVPEPERYLAAKLRDTARTIPGWMAGNLVKSSFLNAWVFEMRGPTGKVYRVVNWGEFGRALAEEDEAERATRNASDRAKFVAKLDYRRFNADWPTDGALDEWMKQRDDEIPF